MNKALLFFNTVRYLKWQQVYYRLLRKFIKPRVSDTFTNFVVGRSKEWIPILLYEEKINESLNACFLNQTRQLDLPKDWNNENLGKLWLYNLHYFEDLLAFNAKEKYSFHTKLLNSWIEDNPTGFGIGWDPYPTSLRIVNILKGWLGGLELDKEILESTHIQASYLSKDLEKHILGNHYFSNLKALFFSGIIFGNSRWIQISEEGLISEIPEQILRDGANFELSPMYHSLMLVDILDIYNLARSYPGICSDHLTSLLEENIPNMLYFMQAMSHPDGGVSFFNDSVDGIAPSQEKIKNYAKQLGFITKPTLSEKCQIIDNSNSGYICATTNNSKLIFDAASVGPNYIPAHAHADTLSFELSIAEQRVFVNSGTSEYEVGSNRVKERKTESHNTVVIDGKDSSEMWGTFRVAKRASVTERYSEIIPNNRVFLFGKHDGYKSAFLGCFHSRELILGNNKLTVRDSISGSFKSAKSYFHFHPNFDVSLQENFLEVRSQRFSMKSNLNGIKHSLDNSLWSPQFGINIKNKVLILEFEGKELEANFIWEILQ